MKKIRDAGGEAVAIAADVSKEADVIATVDGTLPTFGRLDRAFNSAGIDMPNKLVDDLDADEWDSVLDVNQRRLPVHQV